jgi:NAD(P)-dependent dehydrogenase (short-subunit alcohol dehydrogenase family)
MMGALVVTGASRGIGAAIARAGARAGYAVCVNYRNNRAAAEAVVASIEQSGGKAIAVAGDVGDPAEAARLFAECDARFGRLAALVNNAGIIGRMARVDAMDEARLLEVFRTNVFSYFYCAREAVQRMSSKNGGKGGVIVNISSAAARHGGMAAETHYAASKGAIDAFTIGLAKEVGREGVRVVGIRPGLIITEIHDAHGGDETIRQIAPTVPIGRAGLPEEVAEAAIWLCSDAASYVHGATIDVSGGR